MAPITPSDGDFDLLHEFKESNSFVKLKQKLAIFLGKEATSETATKRLFKIWRDYRKNLLPEEVIF